MHTPALVPAASGALGAELPVWSIAPFVLLLLAIAVLPLVAERWWHSNRNRAIVSAVAAIPFVAWLFHSYPAAAGTPVLHAVEEFISFIALLGSLYVISGGIFVKGSLAGTPLANTSLLGVGAVLANLIGTTGASMVLIRPLLRANRSRQRKVHMVVFFMFVVSNCGGMLTPLGDPPLFLGFLKGVPFAWTLTLWKEWLLINGALLVLFHVVDEWVLEREEADRSGSQLEAVMKHERLGLEGRHNLPLLGGVVLVIIGKGEGWGTQAGHWAFGVQEGLMALLAIAAYMATKPATRRANKFTFGPIVEVAVLFAGIFLTMIAPVQILNARGAELGVTEPWQYYWGTGLLSSFLDNAPTYLTFAATAAGTAGVPAEGARYLADYLATGAEAAAILAAISCGAVMMGANTYIGNGPNFMVKAIAEENGVKMPSFFGYMLWSGAILIPLFVGVTFAFFV